MVEISPNQYILIYFSLINCECMNCQMSISTAISNKIIFDENVENQLTDILTIKICLVNM